MQTVGGLLFRGPLCIMSFEIKLEYKYNENQLFYGIDYLFTENYVSSPQIPYHHTLSLSIFCRFSLSLFLPLYL
jgi:hypothetical protein